MDHTEIIQQHIVTRRSIRRYTNREIEDSVVKQIIKNGMYAPSAVNKQPWHYIIFKEQQTKMAICEVHPNASMLKTANKAILVCGDTDLAHAPGYLACDCSAATQNMLLSAHAYGLGGVWIGIYPREERMKALKGIFNLPEHIIPFSIIALGYPAEKKDIPDRFKEERIHYETWEKR